MKRFDIFGQPLPSFNIKGEDVIRTKIGAAVSMMVLVIVLYYGAIKSFHLVTKHNPIIASYVEDAILENNPINLNEINFRAAFAFTNWND